MGFQTSLLPLGSCTCRTPIPASGPPESQAYESQHPIGRTLSFLDRATLGFQGFRAGLGSPPPAHMVYCKCGCSISSCVNGLGVWMHGWHVETCESSVACRAELGCPGDVSVDMDCSQGDITFLCESPGHGDRGKQSGRGAVS